MNRRAISSSLPLALFCLGGWGSAHAQDIASAANVSTTVPLPPALSPGGYAPPELPVPEGVGVADRPRIEYLPIGGRLGSFFLYPNADVTVGTTDNLRAVNTNRISDSYVRVQGGAQVVSNFSRHKLKAGFYVARPFYFRNPREGITQYGASLQGRLDIDRLTAADVTVTGGRSVTDRTDFNSPAGAAAPIAYDHGSARLTVSRTFNRLFIYTSGSVSGYRFRDGISDAGIVINQQFRNKTDYGAELETRYNVYPGFDLLLHGSYISEDYAPPSGAVGQSGNLNRNSTGQTIEGGVRLALTGTLYGEVRAGYLWRDYVDARLRAARGLSFRGDLLWNFTSRSSLRLVADRRVTDASSTTAAGLLTTTLTLGVDQELRRNLIVSADGGYLRLVPLGVGYTADTWTGRLSARYLASRRLSLSAELARANRASLDSTRAYTANTAWLRLSLTL